MTDTDYEFDSEKARLCTLLAEDVGRALAKLAQISETSFMQFCDLLAAAIIPAKRDAPYAREVIRASVVFKSLDRMLAAARKLDKALEPFFDKNGTAGVKFARALLETELVAAGEADAFGLQLTADRRRLAALIAATKKVRKSADGMFPPLPKNKKRAGRPRGTDGNPCFDHFVMSLYEIARIAGGEWTHHQNNYGDHREWGGTLTQALDMLRPYLPPSGFFPEGKKLGYALDRLAERFGADTGENQPIQ
jgi:hypothetical protein